jgi:hypothetical protein
MTENVSRSSSRGMLLRALQMRDFLLAIVFLAGTVLLLGGCLYHDSVEGVAIGFGAVLCVLASIAKDRIDRDMIL